jgi:glycosyltransferase involved in cell wall biosynthesis
MSLDTKYYLPHRLSSMNPAVRVAILSTYPPTPCGIATFSAALANGLIENGHDVSIVRIGDQSLVPVKPVTAILDDVDCQPSRIAIEELNRASVVIVQHEYGLFAGHDGDSIVSVLDQITVPIIVVAHTVLHSPTSRQREVLRAVTMRADAVVVMTDAGRELLVREFAVDERKVSVIPHGAALRTSPVARAGLGTSRLLTWGLLGPGKGIEWVIDALSLLDDLRPHVSYLVAGVTHPKVVSIDGEAYRNMLRARALRNGVAPYVRFDETYKGLDDLSAMIGEAEIVILPYDSVDQVTSGVLVDAVAAGCPVISTTFPHSEELLRSGAGMLVPRKDPEALAAAIREALTTPQRSAQMAAEARRIAPKLAWTAVSAQYATLATRLILTNDRSRA